MKVKHLGDIPFEIIIDCFLKAFENYFVQLPTDHNFYKTRWDAAGVRYDWSYGMFDGDTLVGFIIHAIDHRQGYLTAYNTGTGVLPSYRGQRIVKSIYEYAIPELINNGITKCQLEVITENEKAIKAYQGIGFKICKRYKCYKGRLDATSTMDFTLTKVSPEVMYWDALPNQHFYSWDNQKESVLKANYEYYKVEVNNSLESYFIMDSDSGYVAQCDALSHSLKAWQNLFAEIKSITPNIKINNIDDRLLHKIEAVETAGLENHVDQYEMEVFL